jgi:hypothetical protein
MKKEDIKTKKTYSKDEMKRYIGAISENFNDITKIIKDGFQVVNRKLDEHTEILDRHEKILNSHTEILNRHEKILNSHTEMIGTIMEDVSVLKDDMQIVKKKVDYDEFLSLVRRVNKLEANN